MSKPLSDVPGWKYTIDERSANVYVITATDTRGRRIEATGTDVDRLVEEAAATARGTNADLMRNSTSKRPCPFHAGDLVIHTPSDVGHRTQRVNEVLRD